jgi:hypothetical protein
MARSAFAQQRMRPGQINLLALHAELAPTQCGAPNEAGSPTRSPRAEYPGATWNVIDTLSRQISAGDLECQELRNACRIVAAG